MTKTPALPVFPSLNLKLVHPHTSKFSNPVTTRYQLNKTILTVDFDINVPILYKKDIYGPQDFPYMYDVVEIFIAVNDPKDKTVTYFEYEITPLNQVYNLRLDVIDGKRHSTDLPKINASAQANKDRWSATLKIPLDQIGWNGDVSFLRGNFYAIIDNHPRTYWSAFLPPQDIANFHKPDLFQRLFC